MSAFICLLLVRHVSSGCSLLSLLRRGYVYFMRFCFSLLASCLLCLLFAVSASAQSFPDALVKRDAAFGSSVPSSLRSAFVAVERKAPSRLAGMIDTVDGQLRVRMGSAKFMRGAAGLATWRPDPERPYRIYFSSAIEWDAFSARVVAAHELGHIIDAAGVSGRAMRRVFLAEAKRSKAWRSCFPRPDDDSRCMPLAEIFADQVAFYAIDKPFSSGYGIPRLLSEAQMSRVLKRAWRPQLSPGGVGAD